MARLRQYYANRYSSAEATSAEFESLIRYLNAAELGNNTVSELLKKLFDDDGELKMGIDFRFEAGEGLQVRYDADSDQWTTIISDEDVRGAPGVNFGNIDAPLFFNMQHFTASGVQTSFDYFVSEAAVGVLVWINGILQQESTYNYTVPGTTVTFTSPPSASANVTITTVRTAESSSYLRQDYVAADGQVVFPFDAPEDAEIIVFRNGIFQREGGSYDYVFAQTSGAITMTTPQTAGAFITIINVSNRYLRQVGGLMLEDRYTQNGFIRYDKLSIADNQIPRAKVDGLPGILDVKANITISSTTPTTPASKDLWINTSGSVPALYFYDGTRWISNSAAGLLPLPTTVDALKFLRLNATGTGLEYANFDASNFVTKDTVGNPSGVAPLDAGGLIPSTVIPAFLSKDIINGQITGTVSNGTVTVAIISGGIRVINGLTAILSAGTATIQVEVDGVAVGSTLSASTTVNRLAITNYIVNASTAPKVVRIIVSGATGASNLTFGVETLVTG